MTTVTILRDEQYESIGVLIEMIEELKELVGREKSEEIIFEKVDKLKDYDLVFDSLLSLSGIDQTRVLRGMSYEKLLREIGDGLLLDFEINDVVGLKILLNHKQRPQAYPQGQLTLNEADKLLMGGVRAKVVLANMEPDAKELSAQRILKLANDRGEPLEDRKLFAALGSELTFANVSYFLRHEVSARKIADFLGECWVRTPSREAVVHPAFEPYASLLAAGLSVDKLVWQTMPLADIEMFRSILTSKYSADPELINQRLKYELASR